MNVFTVSLYVLVKSILTLLLRPVAGVMLSADERDQRFLYNVLRVMFSPAWWLLQTIVDAAEGEAIQAFLNDSDNAGLMLMSDNGHMTRFITKRDGEPQDGDIEIAWHFDNTLTYRHSWQMVDGEWEHLDYVQWVAWTMASVKEAIHLTKFRSTRRFNSFMFGVRIAARDYDVSTMKAADSHGVEWDIAYIHTPVPKMKRIIRVLKAIRKDFPIILYGQFGRYERQ